MDLLSWLTLADLGQHRNTTIVFVPSHTLHKEEVPKITGASYLEERYLSLLAVLREPRTRLIYVTSQPVHPALVSFYLRATSGTSESDARRRSHFYSINDNGQKPLAAKLLASPHAIQHIRSLVGSNECAYLCGFTSTALEKQLATALGIGFIGIDAELNWIGTKSGARKVFSDAGVATPMGFEDIHTLDELVDALCELSARHPKVKRALIKLNDSFAGFGNAVISFSNPDSTTTLLVRDAIYQALLRTEWPAPENRDTFLRKLSEMGGVVEELIQAPELRSPSVQLGIKPDGVVVPVSSHDQVLGGQNGFTYVGCHFPAAQKYWSLIRAEATKSASTLGRLGVVGCLGIDFVTYKNDDNQWTCLAVEINLRLGGTTVPFLILRGLIDGTLDPDSGRFFSARGEEKCYYATDRLLSPNYRSLDAKRLMEILRRQKLEFRHATETGVAVHMVGSLPEFGKIGITCIENTREDAYALFKQTAAVLEAESQKPQFPLS